MATSVVVHNQPRKPTKSFQGCWTCRRRGVRCDEQRPQCYRCLKSGHDCEGFGIRLTWLILNQSQFSQQPNADAGNDQRLENYKGPDDTYSGSSRRRYIPNWVSSLSAFEPYDSDALNEALKAVQYHSPGTDTFYDGPFGVFKILTPSEVDTVRTHLVLDELCQGTDARGHNDPGSNDHNANDQGANVQHADLEHSDVEHSDVEHSDESTFCFSQSVTSRSLQEILPNPVLPGSLNTPMHNDLEFSTEKLGTEVDVALATPAFSASVHSFDLASTTCNRTQLDENSQGEAQGAPSDTGTRKALFHFWKRYVSHLMVSIPGENPYLTSITPLAEDSNYLTDPAHFALYHSILAVAAFSRATVIPEKARYVALGTLYYDQTLTALAQCFSRESGSNNEAIVLASIVMTGLVDVFRPVVNSSANWRLHSQAGWEWMRSHDLMSSDDPTVAVLASMVLMPAILGISKRNSFIDFFDPLLVAESNGLRKYRLKFPCFNEYYHLDRVFGIPKRILECILAINAIVQKRSPISEDDINALGYEIVASDPGLSENMYYYGDSEDDFRMHLRYLFYYATEIHFQRSILRCPVKDVSWIVDHSAPHLQALLADQKGPRGPCLLWPIFIIGAECTCARVQGIITTFFSLDNLRTAENYAQAKVLLTEIWGRRDNSAVESSLTWADVMDDMNFDILLV